MVSVTIKFKIMDTDGSGAQRRGFAKRLLDVLLITAAAIIGLHLLLQYLNLEVYHQQNGQIYELSNRFDLDDESSVPTWLAQALFLGIAAAAWMASTLETRKKPRRLWRVIAFTGLIFSVDEVAGLHERVLQTVHVMFFQDSSPTQSDNAWLVLAPLLLALASWLGWTMWRTFPRRTFVIFAAAGFTFVGGAIVVDLLTTTSPRETFLNQGVMVALEEGMELFGAAVALFATADYLEVRFGTRLKSAWRGLGK